MCTLGTQRAGQTMGREDTVNLKGFSEDVTWKRNTRRWVAFWLVLKLREHSRQRDLSRGRQGGVL